MTSSRPKLSFFFLALAIGTLGFFVWRTTRQDGVPAHTSEHVGQSGSSETQPPALDSGFGQDSTTKADNTPSDSKPVHLPEQGTWIVGDQSAREKSTKELISRIYTLRSAVGGSAEKGVEGVAAELGALAQILDSTPLPASSTNVQVPIRRADGTPYSNQGVMAGMDPTAIKDPEQREAYQAALKRNAENGLTRSWLLQAKTDYKTLYGRFEDALKALVSTGSIQQEKANAALDAARRRSQEKKPQ